MRSVGSAASDYLESAVFADTCNAYVSCEDRHGRADRISISNATRAYGLAGSRAAPIVAPRKERNLLTAFLFEAQLAALLFSLRLLTAKKKWVNNYM